jgi:F-type H+-transporting ATPase subunit delta
MAKLVATTYASSLFEVAKETDMVKEISKDLKDVMTIFEENDDFYNFLISPKFSRDDRKKAINKLFEGKISKEFHNFLNILIDKDRARDLKAINKSFNKLLDDDRNIKRVTIESAVALTDEHKKDLIKKLEQSMNCEIILQNIVKPEILGGIILKMDTKIIDNSVRAKLESMEKKISKIVI